jgi:hypothetical protein
VVRVVCLEGSAVRVELAHECCHSPSSRVRIGSYDVFVQRMP